MRLIGGSGEAIGGSGQAVLNTSEDAGGCHKPTLEKTMKTLVAILIAAPILLVGCATNRKAQTNQEAQTNQRPMTYNYQLTVTYNSEPKGAVLVQSNGKSFGQMPVTLNYAVSDTDLTQGKMTLMGFTAQWPSGAKKTHPTMTVNLTNGASQNFTFNRPQDAPFASMDANYAREMQQHEAWQQRVAEEQQRLAAQQKEADQQRLAEEQRAEEGGNVAGVAMLLLGAFAKGYADAKTQQQQLSPRPSTCLVMPMGKDMASVSCN